MPTITVTTTQEVAVHYLRANCGVRYWEDASVNGEEDSEGKIPMRDGDGWCPIIDLETGTILNWPEGVTADVHYKVCDAGIYALLDAHKNVVVEKDGYVPVMLCPGDNGYGDYVIMNIDGAGKIKDWIVDLDYFSDNSH